MVGRKKKRGQRERCAQGELPFANGWGGYRKGAGRKKSKDSGVSHLAREEFAARHPVHVTTKLVPGLPSLRRSKYFLAVLECFEAAQKDDFRIVHFTVQGDHMHLLVEAEGRDALSSGMRGLGVRLARRLNKLWKRKGPLFADRYHSRVLHSPREVRNVLAYIFRNREKHAGEGTVILFDDRSSSMLFDGWKEMEPMELVGRYHPIVPARSWLARTGWKKAGGKLSLYERPKAQRQAAR
jgi:REP element-mobilizing transposase RayT